MGVFCNAVGAFPSTGAHRHEPQKYQARYPCFQLSEQWQRVRDGYAMIALSQNLDRRLKRTRNEVHEGPPLAGGSPGARGARGQLH